MSAEMIATERGKSTILLNGYLYVKRKLLANNISSYECDPRGSGKGLSQCKAKVKLMRICRSSDTLTRALLSFFSDVYVTREGWLPFPLVSQLVDDTGTKFQRLTPYFLGPASQCK